MNLAFVFSRRSTCPRAQVGCVIIGQGHGRVIAHGYNGAPRGLPHCDESILCVTSGEQGCENAVHAEENAIAYAAMVGVSCDGAMLYCTHEPCARCARLIIQAGIEVVTYFNSYRNHDGLNFLHSAGVQVNRGIAV